MRARIHRGAREIGGSCVELEHDRRRLIFDVGRPLNANLGADIPLPAIDGLGAGDEAIAGLVISHGHPDHYGLAEQVHPSVPVFIGEASARILNEARFFGAAGAAMWPGYLEAGAGHGLRGWLERHGIPLSIVHASGHATVADLQRLARTINADRIVPIHTAAPERFPELFERVELHPDGEWWRV